MGRSKITCCINCEDRTIGCHGTCEKYLTQKEIDASEKERINKNKPIFYRHQASLKRIQKSRCIYTKANTHKVLGG